ncbi:hypothetical protein [Flavobacterium sp.]|uniref:hypothetical protein n=1 Tax=Flavobacterium sp. TaxID=239 RepID=UPI00262D8F20|nr:hypothetical protein [Flavobacterium sp.]
MKTNKLLFLGMAVLSLVFTNCDSKEETTKESEFTFGNVVSRDFKGKIVDINNNPIANATISLNGYEVTTNSSGIFSYVNANVKERFAYFTAKKEGYLDGSRLVMSHEGLNELTIMMLPMDVTATIPTGVVSEVTLPNTTKVTFDGSFMLENGTAYNGDVKVIVNHLDAADPKVFDKMPGNLIGEREDGSISGMETYGMINVELRGDDNQKLQITTGHTANISLPIAANQLDTAPSTIPLWHFNETSGMWEENGFARRIGGKYVGNVSHFSWWNCDYAYPVATLNVFVTNADGTPVQGVRVTISRQAGSTGDVLMDLGITGANGSLSAGVPRNEVLTFRAYNVNGVLINTQQLPASNLAVRNVYVVIPFNDRVAAPSKN